MRNLDKLTITVKRECSEPDHEVRDFNGSKVTYCPECGATSNRWDRSITHNYILKEITLTELKEILGQ